MLKNCYLKEMGKRVNSHASPSSKQSKFYFHSPKQVRNLLSNPQTWTWDKIIIPRKLEHLVKEIFRFFVT